MDTCFELPGCFGNLMVSALAVRIEEKGIVKFSMLVKNRIANLPGDFEYTVDMTLPELPHVKF